MLKKQTIWLLTMLSLVIVLSAYYLFSSDDDLAQMSLQQGGEEIVINDIEDLDLEDVAQIGENELFTTIRMELEDKRNIKKDRLQEVIASQNATTNEINEALEEIDALEEVTTKELILQQSILAENETYEDVLVRAEDDKVHVHVVAESLPKEEVVQMMQMVKDELGERKIDVNFQSPTK